MTELRAIPGIADPFSSLSHLVGAALFAALSPSLIRRGLRTGNDEGLQARARALSLVIFAFAAVLLLSMSATFHLLHRGPARDVVQRLDHAAIFILIAATFTPIHTILFRGVWRWGMLAFIWSFAALGVSLKTVFFSETPETLGVLLYVGMGWVGLASMIALGRREGLAFILMMVLGGIAYTIGAAVELLVQRPLVRGVIRAHEIFHVAVLIGLALHWRFIWAAAKWRAGTDAEQKPQTLREAA